jgi:uncharacterized protein
MAVFEKTSLMPVSARELFAWHTRPGAFVRLSPPWGAVELLAQAGDFPERCVKLRVPAGPLKMTWLAQHSNYVEGRSFRDTQVSGPFASWVHDHVMEDVRGEHPHPGPLPEGEGVRGGRSKLTDRVAYEIPLGWLGRAVAGKGIARQLEGMFAYRHKITLRDLGRHALTPAEDKGCKVAITGASGLLGRTLSAFFGSGGHEVVRIGRGAGNDVTWDPTKEDLGLAPGALDGVKWVIHLAGENVGEGRWTEAKKKRMWESRVGVTERLAKYLAGMKVKPEAMICASGIGVYGDRGDEVLTEESAGGAGYFGDLCRAWDGAVTAASEGGVRCVQLRLSMVVTPRGGALEKMLLPFKMGMGGPLGNGKQYWSWISLEDVVGLFHHACVTRGLSGAVNATSPEPVTCREFARQLGKVLRRPSVLPVPGFVLKVLMGEGADALVLASCRAIPERALRSGYVFVHAGLREALEEGFGRFTS